MLLIILFLCTFLIGCPVIDRSRYIIIQDITNSIVKDSSMSVSLYADGKSIVEVHNKFYDSVFEKKNAEFYKKTSFTDFYQLIFNNNFYEIKLWNFNIDSVVIYRELKFYKSVKFIYSNESYDISEAYVCDTLNLCKKANISGNEYNWIIDIRDVKK